MLGRVPSVLKNLLGRVVSLTSLLGRESGKDVDLDLELVELGRSERRGSEEVGKSSLFLGQPLFALGSNPLHSLDIVIGSSLALFVDGSDSLLGLLNNLGALRDVGGEELGSECVKGEDTAGSLGKETGNRSVSARLFVDPVDKLFGSPTRVISDRFLGTLGEELDSGEAGDTVTLSDGLVLSLVGIHQSDDNVGLRGKDFSDLFIGRFHVLAVTAPRSSERDKDIFALVKGDFVKVGSIEFSVSGRRRRLDVGLDARLLGDECSKGFEVSSTAVRNGFKGASREPFESGETRDTESRTELPSDTISISLGDDNFVGRESIGKTLIRRGEVLAMTTPWCEEFNKGTLVLSNNLVKVGTVEVHDVTGRHQRCKSEKSR